MKDDMTKALRVAMVGVAKGAAVVGGAVAAGLGAALTHFAKVGSELADMSARTGVSASALAELGFAAQQSGTDLNAVEKALKFMAKSGKDVKDFDRIAAEIAAITDPSERAAKAMEEFGRAGTELLPMLGDLQALRQQAKDLGLAPSEEDVAMADALGDSFDKLKATLSAGLFKLGAAFAPIVQPALEGAAKAVAQFNLWISANNGVVATLRAIGDALSDGNIGLAGEIVMTELKIIFANGVAALANSLTGTLGDAVGLIATQILHGDLSGAWESTGQAMVVFWDSFVARIVEAFSGAVKVIEAMWRTMAMGISASMAGIAAGFRVVGATIPGGGLWGKSADALEAASRAASSGGVQGGAALGGLAAGSGLAAINRDERAGQGAAQFRGGAAGLEAELAELRRRQEEMRVRAAKAAEVANPGQGAIGDSVTSAFSAAGAAALGFGAGGGGIAKQSLDVQKQILKANAESLRLQKEAAARRDRPGLFS